MSLHFFELLELAKTRRAKDQLLIVFNKDPCFAQLVKIIRGDRRYKTDFAQVINMLKYYNINPTYRGDLYGLTRVLKELQQKAGIKRVKEPIISAGKMLVLILTTRDAEFKHKKYESLRKLLVQCDEIEFKWSMRIIGDKEKLRLIL